MFSSLTFGAGVSEISDVVETGVELSAVETLSELSVDVLVDPLADEIAVLVREELLDETELAVLFTAVAEDELPTDDAGFSFEAQPESNITAAQAETIIFLLAFNIKISPIA